MEASRRDQATFRLRMTLETFGCARADFDLKPDTASGVPVSRLRSASLETSRKMACWYHLKAGPPLAV